MKVPSLEKQIGIETFVSRARGIGGMIKQVPEDFVVEELLVNGSTAKINPELLSHVAGKGRYLICILVKRNWDTILAARKISKQLGISDRRVQIAGIKDKKAVTAQHVSIENVKLKHLKRIRISGINLHPIHYSPSMIFPHMSLGNIFDITIRNISHSLQVTQERMSNVIDTLHKLGGIPNFFGHQRFGTIRPITHLVGKAIAQNNLEKAAFLFLAKPSPFEHPQSRVARQKLKESRDFEEALNDFPHRLLYERLMLHSLAKHPENYVRAFRQLPKRLQGLFLQAYQSYLFNRFLSQRLRRGIPINEPQIGDYVIDVDSNHLPTNSHTITDPQNIKALSKAVKKGFKYVALPLVGFKQGCSEGPQGEAEHTILESEGVTRADFFISSAREMSARGELRSTITPIMNLKVWKPEKDSSNPDRNQLNISFTLIRGCYATVALREFMKPRNIIEAGF